MTKRNIKLFAVIDQYDRIVWTAGNAEHIPDRYKNEKYSVVLLQGEY